jgi:RHS repeat-associated protein
MFNNYSPDARRDYYYTYTADERTGKTGGKHCTYDLNGRQTSLWQDNEGDYPVKYDWDGKIVWHTSFFPDLGMEAKYAPDGTRVWKKYNWNLASYEHKYIYDPVGSVPTLLLVMDAADPAKPIVYTYIHANNQVLARYDGDYTSANKYFYIHDRLGSVRQMINRNGDVINSYFYTPWGTATGGESIENVDNWFGFCGYYYEDGMNSYYCNARNYYNGRFMSRDPVMGKFEEPMTLHKYLYCGNDPVTFIDPDGREIRLGWAKPIGFDWESQEDYHMLLQIIPDDQARYFTAFGSAQYFNVETMQMEFTIDAGPHQPWKAIHKNWTYLEARITGPSDGSSNSNDEYYPNRSTYDFEKLDLYGGNEDYVISALLGAYNYYTENRARVGYQTRPVGGDDGGYNSNSFIHGLLNAVGLDCYYGPPVPTPGWYKPLSGWYFGVEP